MNRLSSSVRSGKKFRNLLRGRASHRHARHDIFRELTLLADDLHTTVNLFLLKNTYKIRPDQWLALTFNKRDWSELNQLATTKNTTLKRNVVLLLEQHIVQNLEAIDRLEVVSTSVSVELLSNPEGDIGELVSSVSLQDRQSLFYWRLLAGAYHKNGSQMLQQIREQMKTDWLVQRFLYPFAFQGLNVSPEQTIPFMLEYVLSGQEMPWELNIIEYATGFRGKLLGNEVPFFWAALLMHPYDAIELVSDCLDQCSANGSLMPDEFNEIFERISNKTNNRRFINSYSRYRGAAIDVVENLSPSSIRLPLPDASKRFLIDCATSERIPTPPEGSVFLSRLCRLRLDKYPNQTDYDSVVVSARIWKFTEGGRLLHGFAASLFMFPRTSWNYECLDFFNLTDFFGEANLFMVTSPGVSTSSHRHQLFSSNWNKIELQVKERLRPVSDIADRTWIKDLLFDVSQHQQQGQIQQWLTKVEEHSPIKRNYVCGADWSWLDEVLRIQKIHPFRGNLKAAYVFLLKNVENSDPDYAVVKSIIRPLLVNQDLDGFIDLCCNEYGERSAAFFYYFLTPENLLLTGLAYSEIDALAGRIHALQACIKRFNFCEIVTEEVYLDELRLLTSAIAYKRLTPSKFEVPWDSFSADQMIRTSDIYDAGLKLSQGAEQGFYMLGEALTENTISFPNRVVQTYTLRNHEWATADLPLEIIKNFMQDPGYGLEAILGTRIRHNQLEHEFTQDIDRVAEANIPGVLMTVSKEIFQDFRGKVRSAVTQWNENYIQSPRKDRPNGVFQLVPDQKDLEFLVNEMKLQSSHRGMVRKTILWIQTKLREGSELAQGLVADELTPALLNGITELQSEMVLSQEHRANDVDRIAAVASAEVSHTLSRIKHWFSWPDDTVVESLSIAEICGAASGRFERQISQGALRIHVSAQLKEIHIPRESVRLVFDIMSELYFNALRHSQLPRSTIRVGILDSRSGRYLFVSNPCKTQAAMEPRNVGGTRFQSEIEHVMNVGGSGHKRIAGAFSTAVKRNEDIIVVTRSNSFHVLFSLNPIEELTQNE